MKSLYRMTLLIFLFAFSLIPFYGISQEIAALDLESTNGSARIESDANAIEEWVGPPVSISQYDETQIDAQRKINLQFAREFVLSYTHFPDSLQFANNNYDLPISERTIDNEDITPFTWKWVTVEMNEPNGKLTAHLRRPLWWIKENEAGKVGNLAFISIPEMAVEGMALVTEIHPSYIDTRVSVFEAAEPYAYRPITGWFERTANETWDYIFSNGDTISCTPNHPFYAEDHKSYLPIGDFAIGERVKLKSGETASLIAKLQRAVGSERVFNIEAWRGHNYFVGEEGILVHNYCLLTFLAKSLQEKKDFIKKIWKDGYPALFKRGTFAEKLIQEKKLAGYNHTGDIMHNFEAIDSFKPKTPWTFVDNGVSEIVQCSEAISIKSTTVTELQSWRNTNGSHLNKLRDNMGGSGIGFAGKKKRIVYDKAKIIIAVPKENLTKVKNWLTTLKTDYPTLDFEVLNLESLL